MRERLRDALGHLAHPRFLVYLMGPYKSFDLQSVLENADVDEAQLDPNAVPESVDFGTLVGSDADLEDDEAVLDLLLHVRDSLRTGPGVNAFLATDIDIPLSEMDAASQSVAFAKASNVVVYIVPKVGDNLGVGIEVGSVLEALYQEDSALETEHRERVLFVHESGVRSAMIASIRDRWDARVYSWETREELVEQVQLFVRDIARRELQGELPRLTTDD